MLRDDTVDLILKFDSEDARQGFFAHWLDGGGDGGGNLNWDTDEWDQKGRTWMRIRGDGYPLDDHGNPIRD